MCLLFTVYLKIRLFFPVQRFSYYKEFHTQPYIIYNNTKGSVNGFDIETDNSYFVTNTFVNQITNFRIFAHKQSSIDETFLNI